MIEDLCLRIIFENWGWTRAVDHYCSILHLFRARVKRYDMVRFGIVVHGMYRKETWVRFAYERIRSSPGHHIMIKRCDYSTEVSFNSSMIIVQALDWYLLGIRKVGFSHPKIATYSGGSNQEKILRPFYLDKVSGQAKSHLQLLPPL